MKSSRRDDEFDRGLEQAWRDLAVGAAPRADCPEPEKIWQAVVGELDGTEIRAVIDHFTECPACSEAWRLARVMSQEAGEAGGEASPGPSAARLKWRYPLAALAAALLLTVGLRFLPGTPDEAPDYRRIPTGELQSTVSGEVLPRKAFVLRWTSAGEGASYSVRVMNEDLRTIDAMDELSEVSYQVSPERLEGITEGDRLLWQVQAELPDGRRLDSGTFTIQLGAAD